MMQTIWIVDSEILYMNDLKYWKEYISEFITGAIKQRKLNVNVRIISDVLEVFKNKEVSNNDHFIFHDTFHPYITQIRYLSLTLGIKIVIHGLWNITSLDDINLQVNKTTRKWKLLYEKLILRTLDFHYFVTEEHLNDISSRLLRFFKIHPRDLDLSVGWPFTGVEHYSLDITYKNKRNMIIFPYPVTMNSQVSIFKEISRNLPQYEFIVAYEKAATLEQLHSLLASSKMTMNCNLNDILGISMYESIYYNSIPMIPKRFAYTSTYDEKFLYPSEWTESFLMSIHHMKDIKEYIQERMENHENYLEPIHENKQKLSLTQFNDKNLIKNIFNT